MSIPPRGPYTPMRPSPKGLHRLTASSPGPQVFSGARNFRMEAVTINLNDRSERDRDEYCQRVARWLCPYDARSSQPDLYAKRTVGTGKWFIDGEGYQRWLRGERKVLWITGMPGAGKSMLTSIAVHDLQERCANSRGEQTIVSFMCQYKSRPSTSTILGSFLRQLYEQQHPETAALIEAAFADTHASTPLSEDDLLDLFQRALGAPHYKKAYIAIDALDELQKDTRDRLLRVLWPLGDSVNLLLSSRPSVLGGPVGKLQAEREIIWEPIAEKNRADIELFVNVALRNTARLVEILENTRSVSSVDIVQKITQKADGMFLLASLQVEALKKCTTGRDLLSKIDRLPSGAEALYRFTMDRIENQDEGEVSLAKRALLWVTYAQTYLTMETLRTALAYVSPTSGVDVYDRPPESVILGCCCGMLVVDQGTRFVRLVHLTADEFIRNLVSEPLFKSPHSFISRHCITYLSSCECLEPDADQVLADEDVAPFTDPNEGDPVIHFSYAYGNWATHAKQALSEPPQDDEMVQIPEDISTFVLRSCRDYTCNITAASSWQRPMRSLAPGSIVPEVIQPIHLVALHGFPSFLRDIDNGEWDARTSTGSSALHLAAFQGDKEIVEILLSDHLDRVNHVDEYGYTPFMLACQQGHADVVEMFLSTKQVADINLRCKYHDATALILATTWGRTSIVKLLVSHPQSTTSLDLHAQDDQGRTALMLACFLGFEDIVKTFVQNTTAACTLNINQSTAFGFTAFTEAALHGSVSIFQLLLSHPDQAFDPSKDTALFRAVKFRREEMVRYLLTLENINVNVRANAGATPLVLAAQEGQEGMCRLLLDHPSIDVNIQDTKGYTALLYAVENGLQWLVDLLLRRPDVQVNAVTTRGRRTALMIASARGDQGLVDSLLAHPDIDLDAKDERRQTALMLAWEAGANKKGIVGSLLRAMRSKPGSRINSAFIRS